MGNRSKPDAAAAAASSQDPQKKKKQRKINFKAAQDVYLRLKQEKADEKERERAEREKRNETIAATNKSRKKMNAALAKRNKKGQPNLNAQMDVLLERIQKKVKSDEKK